MPDDKPIEELEAEVLQLEEEKRSLKYQRDCSIRYFLSVHPENISKAELAQGYSQKMGKELEVIADPMARPMEQPDIDYGTAVIALLDEPKEPTCDEPVTDEQSTNLESDLSNGENLPSTYQDLEETIGKHKVVYALVKDPSIKLTKYVGSKVKNIASLFCQAAIGSLPKPWQEYLADKLYGDSVKAAEFSTLSGLAEGTAGVGVLVGSIMAANQDLILIKNSLGGSGLVIAGIYLATAGYMRTWAIKDVTCHWANGATGSVVVGTPYHLLKFGKNLLCEHIPNGIKRIQQGIENIYANKEKALLESKLNPKLLNEKNPE